MFRFWGRALPEGRDAKPRDLDHNDYSVEHMQKMNLVGLPLWDDHETKVGMVDHGFLGPDGGYYVGGSIPLIDDRARKLAASIENGETQELSLAHEIEMGGLKGRKGYWDGKRPVELSVVSEGDRPGCKIISFLRDPDIQSAGIISKNGFATREDSKMTTPVPPAPASPPPPPPPATPWTKDHVDALIERLESQKKESKVAKQKIKHLEENAEKYEAQQKVMMDTTQKEFEELQKSYVAETGSSSAMGLSDPFKPQTLEQAEMTMPWFREVVTNAAKGRKKKRQDESKMEKLRREALDEKDAGNQFARAMGSKKSSKFANEEEDEEEEDQLTKRRKKSVNDILDTFERMQKLV